MGATSLAMRRLRVVLPCVFAGALCAFGGLGHAQEPRFRGGTNLVRLDVYVSLNGVAVTDLTAADFEVREDSAPQTVTSFEFVRAKGVIPESARTDANNVAEMQSRLQQPDARAFVLFLDTLHVQVEGSYHAANPVATLLDRVIGEDDLVGVMTPEMTARNITFSPRTSSIGEMLRTSWTWGERGSAMPRDPRDQEIERCYPDAGPTAGLALPMLQRRQEARVLVALRDLIEHLEGLREQRSFVLLLSEGWLMSKPDPALGRPISWPGGRQSVPGGPDNIGVAPDGNMTLRERPGDRSFESCERERSLLAYQDFDTEFQLLMRRANRANVSFYPIDPRGLVAFDNPIGPRRPPLPTADARGLATRQSHLRQMAEETDGTVVLNTDIDKALPRLLTDIGSYYLLGYVSTNQKLDGRYRRLSVRVSRPGVDVRARPGYLAPSQSEVSAAQAATTAAPPSSSARVTEALSRLPVGRRTPALYLQAAGAPGGITLTVELDRATAAAPEWAKGGTVRVAVTSAARAGAALATQEVPLAAGTRFGRVQLPRAGFLDTGRYSVRIEALPEGGVTPVVLTTLVDIPPPGGLLGTALMASRRGPGTGRSYEPTADARMRRTERLRLSTPRLSADAAITGRLLNRTGQEMQVPVTISDSPGEDGAPPQVVAEIALAPLAAGEYVVEITAAAGTKTETLSYAVRVVN